MLDKKTFLEKYKLTDKYKACPIPWEKLEEIYDDFNLKRGVLYKKNADELAGGIAEQEICGKHSVAYRVKDPEHLIEKIIRNSTSKSSTKYKKIALNNYDKIITDLIGIRILVLTKEDWEGIHNYLLSVFADEMDNYCNFQGEDFGFVDDVNMRIMVEKPMAYVRYGDKDIFQNKLKKEYTYKDYRSQHYIVKYNNSYCEVQVRTLAEEVYGEFDHKVRYPYNKDNKFLLQYTSVLSKIMVAVDSLVSMCMKLPEEVITQCDGCYDEETYQDWKPKESIREGENLAKENALSKEAKKIRDVGVEIACRK